MRDSTSVWVVPVLYNQWLRDSAQHQVNALSNFDGQKDLELSKPQMHMCMSNLELLQRKKSCVQIGIDSVERNVYYMVKMSHNIKLISFLEKLQKVIM